MRNSSVAFLCGGIGDQLLHFSQLQAFSTLFGTRIDLYCQHVPTMQTISENCDWAGDIHDINDFKKISDLSTYRLAVQRLAAKGYENAFVFHPSTSFKLAVRLASIPVRIGYARGFSDKVLLTDGLSLNHPNLDTEVWGHRPYGAAFDKYLSDKGVEPVGASPISDKASLSQKSVELLAPFPKPHILINLFSADTARRWPVDHAASLLSQMVKRHGGTLFLSAGNDAISWNEGFLRCWPANLGRPVDVGELVNSLKEEMSLYQCADCYVGVNTFTSNLAVNCDLPSLVVYNKRADFLNYRGNSMGVFAEKENRIETISSQTFLNKVDELLGHKQIQVSA